MSQDNRYIGIGRTVKFNEELWLAEPDLKRHCYLLGKTGVGKTTVLLHMAQQWITQGGGMLLLDPHGDLHEDILKRIPKKRRSHVLLIEPGESSVSWNPFCQVPESQRARVAQEIVGAFKAIFADSWGPRLEYIFHNAVRLVLDAENETLLGVQRVLTDGKYRGWLLRQCGDPVIRNFWNNEFNCWDARFQREAISSIQNKLGQVLSDPVLRVILGQRKSSFSPRHLMDEEQIVLVNLSKGLLGEQSSNLLGALLVSGFTSAALTRQEVPEENRATFLLMVDEFQNFTSNAFSSLLSEARKYGLAIVASHQFGAQLRESVRAAVIGNTGTHILFRMGADDAEYFHKEYGHSWESIRFTRLNSFRAVARLLDGGNQVKPMEMFTLPPPSALFDHSDSIRQMSQEKYSRSNEQILSAQNRWFQRRFS